MKRFPLLAVAVLLAAFAAGCDDDDDDNPAGPSGTNPTFSASLLPGNENPPITNADQAASGTMTLVLNATRDAAGNVSSATGNFTVTLTGFPSGTTLTGAHIHPGRPGVNGPVVVSIGVTSSDTVSATGTTTITKSSINVPADIATNMLSDPAGYYFNVHTALNLGGAIRGPLARTQ